MRPLFWNPGSTTGTSCCRGVKEGGGGGGSEYLKTALIPYPAFIKIWESQMSSLPL